MDDTITYSYSCIHALKALLTSDMQMKLDVGYYFIYFLDACLDLSLVAVARDCPGKNPLAAHLLQVVADLAKTPVSNPSLQCTAFPTRS